MIFLFFSWDGTTSKRDVSEWTTLCPIPFGSFAQISWLCEAVVVVIAELGVALFAPWTIQCLYSSCFLLLHCSPCAWIRSYPFHSIWQKFRKKNIEPTMVYIMCICYRQVLLSIT
jgi:hypothetical protein